MRLNEEIIQFFQNQGFVIVTTVDKDGSLHNSCKGVIEINRDGKIYLMDLYKAKTFQNLKRNPNISITSVDEHKFRGWCLKGKAKIVETDKLNTDVLNAWDDKITSRITQRVIRDIHGDRGHSHQPELSLPKPEYMIVMRIEKVIDLTPHHLK